MPDDGKSVTLTHKGTSRRRRWRPSPAERDLILDAAQSGLSPAEISVLVRNPGGAGRLVEAMGDEIEYARVSTTLAAARSLVAKFPSSLSAQVFWLRARAGWRDEQSGQDAKHSVNVTVNVGDAVRIALQQLETLKRGAIIDASAQHLDSMPQSESVTESQATEDKG